MRWELLFQNIGKLAIKKVLWIASIVPNRGYGGYYGEIEVKINPAKKNGTRSNREFALWNMEIDSIKKID